jgi:hypothetical protein
MRDYYRYIREIGTPAETGIFKLLQGPKILNLVTLAIRLGKSESTTKPYLLTD